VARRYRSFLFFGTSAALLTAASFHLPFIVLTAFFGTAAMGQFGLSYRMTTIPVTLVAQSIGQVFFSRAAAARQTPELARLTAQTATTLLALGLPIFGALFVVAPQAFPLIFGPAWQEAGLYARLLAPYLLLSIVAQPLSTLLTVREWQKALLIFTVLELALRMGAIYWGIGTQQMYWAVFLFAASSALVAGLSLGLFFRAAGVRWGDFWSRVRPFVWLNLPILLLLGGLGHWFAGWSLLVWAGLLAGAVLVWTLMQLRKGGLQ
jgi:O-antigen/teichoic acid export membrane protein